MSNLRHCMTPRPVFAIVTLGLLLAGCTGLGAGPHAGDTVDLRYSLADTNGTVLRPEVTTSFVYGSEHSGLGQVVDDALKGHGVNQTVAVDLPAYGEHVFVDRLLAPIPVQQSASRQDFTTYVGEPTLGKSFPAYGIYTGVVTSFDNATVNFEVKAQDGLETPVPSVGAILVTHTGGANLTRELKPVVGSVFAIQPPSPFQPNTPLGLQPGSYRVLGATDTALEYGRSVSPDADLMGKDLHVVVTITKISRGTVPVPTAGNFGVRSSPQVKGDPSVILGTPNPAPTPTTQTT